ncbi:MAG: ABC transporter ATP-binding protein [Bacillota bacterium]|jgi:ABC-type multidrug transport system fused ATPase/permease subunit|nr:ABC transporter ATP-binding protein [Bacillota bacterium]NLL27063.1 ABC transporter ATP-binding protein [Erysipelotrichia bacterium]
MKTLQFFKKYTLQSLIAPLFKMLEAMFELLVPLVIAQIIDIGIANQDSSFIFSQAGLLFLFAILGFSCTFVAQYFSAKVAVNYSGDLREYSFKHIQSLSFEQFDKKSSSTLITNLTHDITQIQNGLNLTLRLLLRSPIIVFGAFVMAFGIDKKISLTFLFIIIILLIIVFSIMLFSIPLYQKVQDKLDKILNLTRENLTGARVIRAFNQQKKEKITFEKNNSELAASQLFAGKIIALFNPVTYLIINFGIILVLQQGAVSVNTGTLTSGQVLALYNYMSQILIELIKMANLTIQITKALASLRRIENILAVKTTEDSGTINQLTDSDIIISFEDVSFRFFDSHHDSLSNLSFDIRKGSKVGIIGPTGSGKSTLINLLCNFYQPTNGIIKLAENNITDYFNKTLSQLISLVPQKASLFKGTVRSNLLWGDNKADDENMQEALKLAQCDFIYQKEGLDTAVLQNGSNFSGGQKQRLTIARALISKSKILILDDSFSALDYATEKKLRQAINSLDYNPTIIIISQRISSIAHCDQILLLDDGKLVGNDNHQNLLKNNVLYQEIYKSQIKEASYE